MEQQLTVFVVDDDPAVRKGIKFLVNSVDLRVAEFSSAQEFLDNYDSTQAGCLILDMRMPDMSCFGFEDELSRPPSE